VITLAESGLADAVEYADIQSHIEDISAVITIQRYGSVWTEHDTEAARSGENFDAAIAGAFLLRVYTDSVSSIEVERLADESGGDASWISVTVVGDVSDIDVDVPPSLVTNGLTARIFYYTTSGKIKYTESSDITNTSFAVPVEVGTVADVIYLAAVSTTKVYYITENSNNNRVLHVYEYNGSWSNTDSDIYWPYVIHAFDAVTFETGRDLLMLATDLPPLVGSRVVGAEVQQEVTRVQGLVTFWVANGRWSDHGVIDVIDKVEVTPSRTSLRLSFHNNFLFGAYLRRGGTEDYPYSKAAVVRSKDGVNWEFPELIDSFTPPFAILPRTDYLYAVGVNKTLRSPCCAWAGQTPAELDVTDYVVGMESSAAEIRNSQVRLSNPANVLAGTLVTEDARLQVVYDLGYMVSGSGLRAQVSLEDVVSRQAQSMLPHLGTGLATRDFLGRVNRVRSDYAAEWPGIQAGRDTYNDPSETGYGGMRHAAPYEGSWKTPGESEIHLISKNKEGIAVSTFVTDALNGSAETGFQVATSSNSEYAGIAFRTFDKDNLLFFIYDQDTDSLKLAPGVGTDTNDDDERDDTTLATSYSVMGWAITTWYWLKVVVRYSLVYAFYSTDGITWIAVTWDDGTTDPIELDGQLDGISWEGGGAVLSGRFGLIGYGYSDDDAWPPYEPPPWIPPVPPVDPIPDKVVVFDGTFLCRTTNFDDDYPSWTDIVPQDFADVGGSDGPIHDVCMDADGIGAWLVSGAGTDAGGGVWYTPDIAASTVSWTLVLTQVAANAMKDLVGGARKDWGRLCSIVSFAPGSACVMERAWPGSYDRDATAAFYTSSEGAAWGCTYLSFAAPSSDTRFWCPDRDSIYPHRNQVFYVGGQLMALGISGRWNASPPCPARLSYIVSADGGATWALTRDAASTEAFGSGGQAAGTMYGTTTTGNLYSVVGFGYIDEYFTKSSNWGAVGLQHPVALFIPRGNSADTKQYLWRDGVHILEADSVPNFDSLRSVTPWAYGHDRYILVQPATVLVAPLIYWVHAGTLHDKTGNLFTVAGGWRLGLCGHPRHRCRDGDRRGLHLGVRERGPEYGRHTFGVVQSGLV
jgi:hypothetical protein